jgi:hypothetical protein
VSAEPLESTQGAPEPDGTGAVGSRIFRFIAGHRQEGLFHPTQSGDAAEAWTLSLKRGPLLGTTAMVLVFSKPSGRADVYRKIVQTQVSPVREMHLACGQHTDSQWAV